MLAFGQVRQSMARIKFVVGERARLHNQNKEEMAAVAKKQATQAHKDATAAKRTAQFESDTDEMVKVLLQEKKLWNYIEQ